MEKASGELSLTVVTIIAIAAIAGLVALLWPTLSNWISDEFGNITGTELQQPNQQQ